MENGFKAMSQIADSDDGHDDGDNDGARKTSRSNGFGVDTDQIASAATERVSELQEMIIDEVRARPLRALGWAAAAGVILGFWASR